MYCEQAISFSVNSWQSDEPAIILKPGPFFNSIILIILTIA